MHSPNSRIFTISGSQITGRFSTRLGPTWTSNRQERHNDQSNKRAAHATNVNSNMGSMGTGPHAYDCYSHHRNGVSSSNIDSNHYLHPESQTISIRPSLEANTPAQKNSNLCHNQSRLICSIPGPSSQRILQSGTSGHSIYSIYIHPRIYSTSSTLKKGDQSCVHITRKEKNFLLSYYAKIFFSNRGVKLSEILICITSNQKSEVTSQQNNEVKPKTTK